jgi:hypothetical protein
MGLNDGTVFAGISPDLDFPLTACDYGQQAQEHEQYSHVREVKQPEG